MKLPTQLTELIDKARETTVVSKMSEMIKHGVGTVATQIDKRTDGKYSEKLERFTGADDTGEEIDLTDAPVDLTESADAVAEEAADAAEATQEELES